MLEMATPEARETEETTLMNGIDVGEYGNIVTVVRAQPELAKFCFRGRNAWMSGARNRTTFDGFYGAGEEHGATGRSFVVEADDPPVYLGTDQAPTPVEFLLHALSACLTSTIVYKAAARGIAVESIESTIEGDLDASRFLEIGDDGRTGYEDIRVTFRVETDASLDVIDELARFSPVLDVVGRGTRVNLCFERG